MRPLNQLNNPFVPSLSHTRLGGTRNLTKRVNRDSMRAERIDNARISIHKEHIQR